MHADACYWAVAHCLSWAPVHGLLSDLISSVHAPSATWKHCSNVSPRALRSTAPIVTAPAVAPSPSTFAERYVGGFVVGGLAALASAERYDDQPAAVGYALGSAAGVLLATVPRERPRTLSILLGAALGAVPLFALASHLSSHPFSLPIFIVGAVATPLLGAAGQRWRIVSLLCHPIGRLTFRWS